MRTVALAPTSSWSLGFFRDVTQLAKPRITLNVVCTAAAGLWLAPVTVSHARWTAAILGMALLVAGANALNMLLERDVDGKMTRTANRPLPAGRLPPSIALLCGVAWSVPALAMLAPVNTLTVVLGAVSLFFYVGCYTPLKRHSTAALLVGAIPGAMPPLMGWTAATGLIDGGGLALFAILFVWQLPHFIAISLFRAEEYGRAGLKVVPNVQGVEGAKLRIALYSLLMLMVSLEVLHTRLASPLYLAAALLLGGGLVTLAAYGLQKDAGRRWARWYFFYTLIYLPGLLGALAAGAHRAGAGPIL